MILACLFILIFKFRSWSLVRSAIDFFGCTENWEHMVLEMESYWVLCACLMRQIWAKREKIKDYVFVEFSPIGLWEMRNREWKKEFMVCALLVRLLRKLSKKWNVMVLWIFVWHEFFLLLKLHFFWSFRENSGLTRHCIW